MTRTDRRRFPNLFAAISTVALPAAVLLAACNDAVSAQTDGTGICDRTRQVGATRFSTSSTTSTARL